MIGKIVSGTLEVVVAIVGGILKYSVELFKNSDEIFEELNTKLMGSYEEIEKLEAKKK